ncbi:protein-glutamine gamma-glutamyltransferase [Faecalispora anaeroviscerum]|uniref:protein-glutamine gamma-glutamyltransferase n=1 Tax=Faecalispora anaeroviscerum TaxID=2991836 RepID=UPI0024B89335|nr:protein-glutamine gamma-glutamyltransferase [Faecalispora anaeroviscerum]
MITISGSPFQISEIIGDYSENSVERQLLEQMSKSTETYRYDTLEQLKFELAMRREIVEAAKKLNRSGLKFAVFHKSECNPDYWERTSNGGFLLKSGVKPSDAIRDIFTNGRKYATECATAMVILYYKALLEVLPEEKFNSLFPSIYLMNWHKLDPLLREAGAPETVTDILLGDRGYFKNPEVDPKVSELQGENVIVLPDELYYGHGVGITSADRIIRMLNANRIEDATQSAYFIENSAARPDFKKLANASQEPASRPAILHWRPFPQPISG